ATNVHLEKAIQEKRFREDLYYRLNVLPISIPPLRFRKEDLPLLANHLIKKFNQEYGRNVEEIDEEAVQALMDYDWPGNVRELENVLGRAMINMNFSERRMKREHLPPLHGAAISRAGSDVPEKPGGDVEGPRRRGCSAAVRLRWAGARAGTGKRVGPCEDQHEFQRAADEKGAPPSAPRRGDQPGRFRRPRNTRRRHGESAGGAGPGGTG